MFVSVARVDANIECFRAAAVKLIQNMQSTREKRQILLPACTYYTSFQLLVQSNKHRTNDVTQHTSKTLTLEIFFMRSSLFFICCSFVADVTHELNVFPFVLFEHLLNAQRSFQRTNSSLLIANKAAGHWYPFTRVLQRSFCLIYD